MDDDYQEITGLDEPALLRRLSCYYLLAPSLVVHPAYFWQSTPTHNLVGTIGKQILRPPFTHLELGMHDSIKDYMEQRISQLKRSDVGTRELRSYESYGPELVREASDLDVRFNTAERRPTSARKRDQEFRGNLEADLNSRNIDDTTLASLLNTLTISPTGGLVQGSLGTDLLDFVTDVDLVSVDTVLHELYARGYPELANNAPIRRRLLSLYYKTYSDWDLIIPGTDKLKPGNIVNPYDTEFFWKVMSGLFGRNCEHLANPGHPELIRSLQDIRESSDWLSFTTMYFNMMATVDGSVRSQPETVVAAVQRLHPGKSRNFVLRRLWEQGKVAASGAILSVASAAGFTLGGTTAVILTATGAAGITVSGISLIQLVRRFTDQFNAQDMVKINATIKEQVDRALRDVSLRNSGGN